MATMNDTQEPFRASEPVKYYDKDGGRLPSTTTIQGAYKNPAGLMYYAWECGMQGIDYRQETNRFAGAGTICHKMIENKLTHRDIDAYIPGAEELGLEKEAYESAMRMAENGFDNFESWWMQTHGEAVELEVSMVDDDLGFGGTLDLVVKLFGRARFVTDFKTSKKLYEEHICQVAAYRHLWMNGRMNVDQKGSLTSEPKEFGEPIHGGIVLRVNRETSEFMPYIIPTAGMDLAFEQFRYLLRAYKMKSEIGKIAKAAELIVADRETCDRIVDGNFVPPKPKRKTRKKTKDIKPLELS